MLSDLSLISRDNVPMMSESDLTDLTLVVVFFGAGESLGSLVMLGIPSHPVSAFPNLLLQYNTDCNRDRY